MQAGTRAAPVGEYGVAQVHTDRRTHAYGVQIIQRSPDSGESNQKASTCSIHVCLLIRYIHIQAAHARQHTHQTKKKKKPRWSCVLFPTPVQHAITRTSTEIISSRISATSYHFFTANCCLRTISCHQSPMKPKMNKIISGKGMWPPPPQPRGSQQRNPHNETRHMAILNP